MLTLLLFNTEIKRLYRTLLISDYCYLFLKVKRLLMKVLEILSAGK